MLANFFETRADERDLFPSDDAADCIAVFVVNLVTLPPSPFIT